VSGRKFGFAFERPVESNLKSERRQANVSTQG
jgi:hypothetical protein